MVAVVLLQVVAHVGAKSRLRIEQGENNLSGYSITVSLTQSATANKSRHRDRLGRQMPRQTQAQAQRH